MQNLDFNSYLHSTQSVFKSFTSCLRAFFQLLKGPFKERKVVALCVIVLSSVLFMTACSSWFKAWENRISRNSSSQLGAKDFESKNIPGGIEDPNIKGNTGKVGMSLMLGQLGDGSGPGFSLKATYSSNVQNSVKIWNRDYQTPNLGLGWELPEGRIIRHTNDTGNEDDDHFYLTLPSGGGVIELIYDSVDSADPNIIHYRPKGSYAPSMLARLYKFNDVPNKKYSTWIITMGTGQRYFYGGNIGIESGSQKSPEYTEICDHITNNVEGNKLPPAVADCMSGSVELGIRWGNWIGPSYEDTSQEQFEVGWWVSAIQDTLGRQTIFSYIQDIQNVGDSTSAKSFTQQTYLYRIQQPSGEKLVLRYCPRAEGTDVSKTKGQDQGIKKVSRIGKKGDGDKGHQSTKGQDNPGKEIQKLSRSGAGDSTICIVPGKIYQEFVDPWQINAEPDGYQERYSSLYVGAVDHQSDSSITDLSQPTLRTLLQSDFLTTDGTAELAKRILVGVVRQTYDSDLHQVVDVAPPTNYVYWGQSSTDGVSVQVDDSSNIFNEQTQGLYGSIKLVTSPSGATKKYRYKQMELDITRQLMVNDFVNYDQKWPLFGGNHVVIAGTSNDATLIKVYNWTLQGWKGFTVYQGGPPGPAGYNPFRYIALQDNYIAFLHSDLGTVSVAHYNYASQSWEDAITLGSFSPYSGNSIEGGEDFLGIVSIDSRGPISGQQNVVKYNLFETPDQGQTWSQVLSGNVVDTSTPIYSSFWRTSGIGVGRNYVTVGATQADHDTREGPYTQPNYDLDLVLLYRSLEGKWHNSGVQTFKVPNLTGRVSGKSWITPPSDEPQPWASPSAGLSGGFIKSDPRVQFLDFSPSSSILGVGINNLTSQWGRLDKQANFSQSAFLMSPFAVDPVAKQLTYLNNISYYQNPSAYPGFVEYSGKENILAYFSSGRRQTSAYGMNVSAGTSFNANSMATAMVGFTPQAFQMRYASGDPMGEKISMLVANCSFALFDGKSYNSTQIFEANPDQDSSGLTLRGYPPLLVGQPPIYLTPSIKNEAFGIDSSSPSDLTPKAPCGQPMTQVLPGGVIAYSDAAGVSQYVIGDPKTKSYRIIDVSGVNRVPTRPSVLNTLAKVRQEKLKAERTQKILQGVGMGVAVIGALFALADPVSFVMFLAFTGVSVGLEIGEKEAAAHYTHAINRILSKLAGAAPGQRNANGTYIQDGDVLLFQQPNGSLNLVESEIDTNNLYNVNFSANRGFVVYTTLGSSGPSSIGSTKVAVLRNGILYKNPENLSEELKVSTLIHQGQFNDSFYSLSSAANFVTYNGSKNGSWSCPTLAFGVYHGGEGEGDGACFTDSDGAFFIHHFLGEKSTGNITDFVVDTVTVDDGVQSYSTIYEYANGNYDDTSTTGIYETVSIYPGQTTATGGKTYKEFINGRNSSDLTVSVCNYQLEDQQQGGKQAGAKAPSPENCSDQPVNSFFNVLRGYLYSTKTIAADSTVVDERITDFRILKILDSNGKFQSYKPLPISKTHSRDGVSQTIQFGYDPYFQKNKTTFSTKNYLGNSSMIDEQVITTKRFAYEDYPEMLTQNIFHPLSEKKMIRQYGTVAQPKTSRSTKITYKNWQSAKEGRAWLSESVQVLSQFPEDSQGTFVTMSTLERDTSSGHATKSTNSDGMVATQKLSVDGRHIPYANYVNGDFYAGQADYYGFEFFEPPLANSSWKVSGGDLSQNIAYTGSVSYGSDTAQVTLTPSQFTPKQGTYSVVSAWVFPKNDKSCTIQLGSGKSTSSSEARWQYIEVTSNSNTAPTISCYGYVDDMRFGPVDGVFSAHVYDRSMKILAKHGNNGEAAHNVYDFRQLKVATYRTTDHSTGEISLQIDLAGYSRWSGSNSNEISDNFASLPFDLSLPNSLSSIRVLSPSGNQFISLESSGETLPVINVGPSFVIHAEFVSSDSPLEMTIGGTKLQLRYDSVTRIFYLNQFTSKALTADAAVPGLITLFVNKNMGLLFGDGKLLISTRELSPLTDEQNPLKILDGIARFIMVGQDPVISQSYLDGRGRVIQAQRLGLDTNDQPMTTIAYGVLYDGWGHPSVRTLNMEYDSSPTGFQVGLISSFDWNGPGVMAGDIINYFESGPGKSVAQGDYQYPYTYAGSKASPLARQDSQSSQPGKAFLRTGKLDLSWEYQSDDTKNLFNKIGIPSADFQDFHGQSTKVPFSSSQMQLKQSIADTSGRLLARNTSTSSGDLLTSNAYTYNQSLFTGQKLHRSPNFYNPPNKEINSFSFLSSLSQVDLWGSVSVSTESDLTGATYRIYDRGMKLRFVSYGANFKCLNYFKYDIRGRKIESGVLQPSEVHSMRDYQTMANQMNYPSSQQAYWSMRYSYDLNASVAADPMSVSLKGRLFQIVRNNDAIVTNGSSCQQGSTGQTTQHRFQYDLPGRIVVSSLQTVLGSTSQIRNTGYTHNNVGQTTGVTYPTKDQSQSSNPFDLSGQPTIYYGLNPIGQLSSICDQQDCSRVKYASNYKYNINGLRVGNQMNNGKLQQTFTYDLQSRLGQISTASTVSAASFESAANVSNTKGTANTVNTASPAKATTVAARGTTTPIFEEKITYATDDEESGFQGGYVIRTEYTGTGLGDSGAHAYDYQYSLFGRLTQATRFKGDQLNEKDRTFSYSYDSNGNPLTTSLEIEGGTSSTDTFTYRTGNRLAYVTENTSKRYMNYNDRGALVADITGTGDDNSLLTYVRNMSENRIISAVTDTETINYKYDGFGRRIQVTNQSTSIAPKDAQLPIGIDDTWMTSMGKELSQGAPGVLGNDLEASGATASLVESPSEGTLTLNSDGSFNYKPNGTYIGSDSFSYVPVAGTQKGSPARVVLQVLPAPLDDIPTLSYTTVQGVPLSFSEPVLKSNIIGLAPSFPPTFIAIPPSVGGTVKIAPAGSFAFIPDSSFTGTASFKYRVSSALQSGVGTVNIKVTVPPKK